MSPAKEIIVINPNSNEHVTSSMDTALEPLRLANGPIIKSVTNLDRPPGIESQQDADSAALQVINIIKRNNSADAFVIACFSDPGIYAAREVTNKPVFDKCLIKSSISDLYASEKKKVFELSIIASLRLISPWPPFFHPR